MAAVTVYASKIDGWLAAVLGAAVVSSLWASRHLLLAGSPAAWLAAPLIACVGAGLPLWVLLDTRYVVDATHLRIRSGPFRWTVPIAGIVRIAPTSNPLSSPALSLDRLRIEYGRGASVMVSPRDRAGFMRAIEAARKQPG